MGPVRANILVGSSFVTDCPSLAPNARFHDSRRHTHAVGEARELINRQLLAQRALRPPIIALGHLESCQDHGWGGYIT